MLCKPALQMAEQYSGFFSCRPNDGRICPKSCPTVRAVHGSTNWFSAHRAPYTPYPNSSNFQPPRTSRYQNFHAESCRSPLDRLHFICFYMAADPLSVAGTAVGIVSLGLSLCQGLTDYLGALKCRKEDIQSATSQVEGLQAAFGAIQIALPKLSADSQASAAVVKHSLQSCEAELDKLNTLLEGFKKEAAPANGIE